jgi:hypothetical protein
MEQYIIKCNGKEYAAVLKQRNEIEDCKEGKFVHLEFNDESYTGIFHGIHGDYIMLKSLSSDKIIGLPIKRLKSYFEEL